MVEFNDHNFLHNYSKIIEVDGKLFRNIMLLRECGCVVL